MQTHDITTLIPPYPNFANAAKRLPTGYPAMGHRDLTRPTPAARTATASHDHQDHGHRPEARQSCRRITRHAPHPGGRTGSQLQPPPTADRHDLAGSRPAPDEATKARTTFHRTPKTFHYFRRTTKENGVKPGESADPYRWTPGRTRAPPGGRGDYHAAKNLERLQSFYENNILSRDGKGRARPRRRRPAQVLPTAHMEPFRDRVNGATP